MTSESSTPEAELAIPGDFIDLRISHEINKPREKCGVVGVFTDSPGEVADITLRALEALQHRGYDAAGILLYSKDDRRFTGIKDVGRVDQVFSQGAVRLQSMAPEAVVGVAHVRYITDGDPKGNGPRGDEICLAHNGTVDNAYDVAREYGIDPLICVNDTDAITRTITKVAERTKDVIPALQEVLPKLQGAYSLAVSDGQKLIAVRDPNAIRPLSIGRLSNGGYIIASETVALDAVGAVWKRDVRPGEIISIEKDELGFKMRMHAYARSTSINICGLEPDYLMHPESEIENPNFALDYYLWQNKLGIYGGQILNTLEFDEGRSRPQQKYKVKDLRRVLGNQLAYEHPIENNGQIVVGVPSSGVHAAKAYAEALGLPYEQLIIKNPDFQGRSFIAPDEEARTIINAQKLLFEPKDIEGKRLVFVDDSAIRGSVMKRLIARSRAAGAESIEVCLTFPVMVDGCHLGTATSDTEKLLSYNRDLLQMAKEVDADRLSFMSAEGYEAVLKRRIGGLCLGCVTRKFPVPKHRLLTPAFV